MARPAKVIDGATVSFRIDKHLFDWLDDKRFDVRMDRSDFFRHIFSDYAVKNGYKAPVAEVDPDPAD